jgi:fumarate hydratase class II
MKYRIEHDSMGDVKVPGSKYWGAQTERSRNNFRIGPEASMPPEIIRAFGYIKKAAAMANYELGILTSEKKEMITGVCDEIIEGRLMVNFPWLSGRQAPAPRPI